MAHKHYNSEHLIIAAFETAREKAIEEARRLEFKIHFSPDQAASLALTNLKVRIARGDKSKAKKIANGR